MPVSNNKAATTAAAAGTTATTATTTNACTPAAIAAAAAQLEFLLEPKYSTFTPPSSMASSLADVEEAGDNVLGIEEGEGDADADAGEILYEFLCCAKCMNEQRAGHNGTCASANRRLQRFLRHCNSNNNNNNEAQQFNEPTMSCVQVLDDPVSSIASKYARRQQQTRQRHKQHGTVSMGIARNRANNNRHHHHSKLPMHSVKIFHNRSSYSPLSGACTTPLAVGVGVPTSTTTTATATTTTTTAETTTTTTASVSRVESVSLSVTAALSTSTTLPIYAIVSKKRDANIEKTETTTTTAMLAAVPEEPTTTTAATAATTVQDLISFDDDDNQNASLAMTTTTARNTCDNHVDLLCAPNDVSDDAANLVSLLATPPPTPPKPNSPGSNNSSRKTSFDSTCTISSMDSGFMEMQHKLDALAAAAAASGTGEKIARRNYKECLTQSRNRRKSYEEFKAMFADATQTEAATAARLTRRRCGTWQQQEQQHVGETAVGVVEVAATLPILVADDATTTANNSNNTVMTTLASISEQETTSTGNNNNSNNTKPDCVNEFAATTTDEMDTGDDLTTTTASSATAVGNAVNSTTTEAMRKNSDFLSQILDHQLAAKEQREKAHKRRTSYEEFKRLVREIDGGVLGGVEHPVMECQLDTPTATATTAAATTTSTATTTTPTSPLKRQNSRQRKSFASYFLPRRNSTKEQKTELELDTGKAEMEQQQQLLAYAKMAGRNNSCSGASSNSSASYRRNFKIYDKLVYGTIYDIIQRKNDIYQLTYQKYDKYMTYGTIYEILHRKSSTTSQSSNSLTSGSNDKWQRKSLSSILERDTTATTATSLKMHKSNDVIYDIIQKQQQEREKELQKELERAQQQSEQQQNQPQQQQQQQDATTANLGTHVTHKYGTIYDILQGEKLDAGEEAITESKPVATTTTTRFVVSHVDEQQIGAATATATDNVLNASSAAVAPAATVAAVELASKCSKMRRLSNILSYSKSGNSNNASQELANNDLGQQHQQQQQHQPKRSQAKRRVGVSNLLLPLDSEELYTRIIAQQRREGSTSSNSSSDADCRMALMKSNSLDAISMSVAISPPTTPSPPRPRRSLKQHKCLQQQQQQQQQQSQHKQQLPPLMKKHSLDNGPAPKQPLRRWSNQTILKCTCQTATVEEPLVRPSHCHCTCPTPATIVAAGTAAATALSAIDKCRSLPAACSHTCLNLIATVAGCDAAATPMAKSNSKTTTATNAKTTTTTTTTATTTSIPTSATTTSKKGKSRRLSEFTRGEFLNEKS
ncbi:hypothetical protein ACLKA6_010534 [Drosophila palustris]